MSGDEDVDWRDVSRAIEGGESPTVEFKRQFGNLKQVGRVLCALANTDGGVIVVGVSDDGTVVGENPDERAVKERLASFLDSGCSSPVAAYIGSHQGESGTLYWIDVPRQRRYEPFRYGGRFYIRRDRSSVQPSASELQELFNKFGFVLTEEQVVSSGSIEDIDLLAFRRHQRRQGIDLEADSGISPLEDLLAAGVLAEADGAERPTLYGLMAFGRAPQGHPHTRAFYVQCARYLGRDRGADLAIVGDSTGRLEDQVARSLGWFRSLGRTERYEGAYRIEQPLLPEKVIRESIVNAVVHRDYAILGSKVMLEVFEDRIEVTSPGTLPNHMTVLNVTAGGRPRSRNESMAHAALVARLMEQRGRGWPLMRRLMREFNGTEPELVDDRQNRFVRVRFDLRASVG